MQNVVHPPLIDTAVFEEVQQILHGRGSGPGHEHKKHRSRHPYVLNRCRYAQEYALANKINHPRNVYLRERDLGIPLDHVSPAV